MKIAVISDHIPSKWAHSINTMNQAQAFYNLGHQVEILCIQRLLELKNRIKIKNIYDFYGINKNIKLKFFFDFSPSFLRELRLIGPFSEFVTYKILKIFPKSNFFFNVEKRISNYCKKENVDLVYCRRSEEAAYYNVRNNILTVVETHLYLTEIPYPFKKLMNIINKKQFKALITISPILKDRFVKLGFPRDKVIVMEDAVHLLEFKSINLQKQNLRKKLRLPNSKKIILHLGSLYKDRGIDTVLKSSMYFECKGVIFCFLGGKEKDIKYWKKFLVKNKIKANILFLGHKSRKLVPYYLKSADILLAPYSLRCTTAEWMSPLKIYEYMASNTPIISSDLKRMKEICNNNECLFFKSDNPFDLSEKIQTLLNNNSLQQKLVKNAYMKVQQHSFLERCKKILKLSIS